MENINTKPVPGCLELLPGDQINFDQIMKIIASIYKKHGFTGIDSPVFERNSILLAKGGGETEKQIYSVMNRNSLIKGDENDTADLSLRFDLTVPLARYVAEHFNSLSFPFRRYHIGKVYRGERPQSGRFREFYQCDIDVIGKDSLSIRYDAEIPSIIYEIFKELNFGKFTIRINNRKLLNGLIASLNITSDTTEILHIIDKAEKISEEDLRQMFYQQNVRGEDLEKLMGFISIKGDTQKVISDLRELKIDNSVFMEGVEELETVTTMLEDMGVESDYYMIDLSIARGLDYYTGTVYETKIDDYPQLGSVCSGGRYDNLASYYIDEKLPGVGISIGLTRLFYQLKAIGLCSSTKKTIADVIVLPIEESNISSALRLAHELRQKDLSVDVLLEDFSIKKKFKYVAKKDPAFTVVIGESEEMTGKYTLQYKEDEYVKKTIVPKANMASTIMAIKGGTGDGV